MRVRLFPPALVWSVKRPTWEDLRLRSPEELAGLIAELLGDVGAKVSPSLLAEALKGRAGGLEALGLSLLADY